MNITRTVSIDDSNIRNVTANFNASTIINPDIGGNINIMQLNVEGISKQKCEYMEKQFVDEDIDVAVVQETHLKQEGPRSEIRGYTMVAAKHHYHVKFGLATYVKDDLLPSTQVIASNSTFYAGITINDLTIVNVYKPQSANLEENVLPKFDKPSIVLGDFNSHNTLWGYTSDDNDGNKVKDWMERQNYSLLFDSNDPGTFQSRTWNQSYTPDLCFVSQDQTGQMISATRRILRGFANSQQQKTKKFFPVTADEIATQMVRNSNGIVSQQQKKFVDNIERISTFRKLTKFFNNIKLAGKIPKQWKIAKVMAVLKPNKSSNEVTSYRLISLLSCCYKLFERCILARIRPIIEDVIPRKIETVANWFFI